MHVVLSKWLKIMCYAKNIGSVKLKRRTILENNVIKQKN